MLQPVYYIISPDSLQEAETPFTNNIIVLEMDLADRSLLYYYHFINRLPVNNRFCVLTYINGKINDALSNDIIAFFFFPNYHKPNNIPEFLVQVTIPEEAITFKKTLIQQAKAQGFAEINIQTLPVEESAEAVIHTESEIKKIKELYRSLLESNKPTFSLYIRVLKLTDISKIDKILEEEELIFKQQNERVYSLKKQNIQLVEQLQQLEIVCKAATNEITNLQSHIDILRSNAQAVELQNFYHNEYEVLPLWYKRFGHIIKVVTGKRSFRSLFNHNIKKYND